MGSFIYFFHKKVCPPYFTLMISTLGLAIAFSPTAERMLAEAVALAERFKARLVLIHVGEHGEKEEQLLNLLLARHPFPSERLAVRWEKGDPARAILKVCDDEFIDLLVAGALKKENLLHYYLGTIARTIMRRAHCSVLLLTQPSPNPDGFKNVVVDAEDGPFVNETISLACQLCQAQNKAWVHVVRELKLYGLAMSASDQCSEDEYELIRQGLIKDEVEKVEGFLEKIPHGNLKINIKVISGKSGFELSQFAQRKQADLLVVGAPVRRFSLFDRVFTHDLEYIFADMPCNLLIVNSRKEETGA